MEHNIELAFNPYTRGNGTEKIFKCPVVAKFYLLWRSKHLTDQFFAKNCERLIVRLKPSLGDYDVLEFVEALRDCNLGNAMFSHGTTSITWVMNHWDYFNPNIRRTLEFKHKFKKGEKISEIT